MTEARPRSDRVKRDRVECLLTLDEINALTLDECIERSQRILVDAIETWRPVAVVGLFSGGNDSTTMMHTCRSWLTHAAHINTGIGVEQTRQYVRDTCDAWNLPLIEEHPPPGDTYRELVLRFGFPGPAGHGLMYRRLKERGLRQVRRRFISNGRKERVIFVAGMRVAESSRRFRNANEIDREGSVVWVSPIVHWNSDHMKSYRATHDVPFNEVTANLHMSGECLCGSFAKPGELEQIRFFYPDVAEQIDTLEAEVAATGNARCKWGVKVSGRPSRNVGILKRELIRKWLERTYEPDQAQVYLGIDWTEEHRYIRAKPYWQPYTVLAPLCDPPLTDKNQVLEDLKAEGIRPPRLYEMGFPHNNCGGFCIKAGHAHFKLLLEQLPERYAYHEEKEQMLREYLGKDIAILRDRRGGTTKPFTLRQLRNRIENGGDVDPTDLGGCGCFSPEENL